MKGIVWIVVGAFIIPGFSFGAAEIPEKFREKWAHAEDYHAFAEAGVPDPGVEVTKTEFNRIENYCALERVIKISPSTFTGKFKCAVEGEESIEEIYFAVDKKGRLGYKGVVALSRCK